MNRKECTTPISMISLLLLLLETDNDDTLYFDWLINLLTEQIAIFPMIIHFSNASDEKWNIYREIYDDVWEMYERFFFVVEFVLFVCVRLSSHTQCHAFSLFTSPFFVSLELVVFPLFLNKILDVSFDTLETIYMSVCIFQCWLFLATMERENKILFLKLLFPVAGQEAIHISICFAKSIIPQSIVYRHQALSLESIAIWQFYQEKNERETFPCIPMKMHLIGFTFIIVFRLS